MPGYILPWLTIVAAFKAYDTQTCPEVREAVIYTLDCRFTLELSDFIKMRSDKMKVLGIIGLTLMVLSGCSTTATEPPMPPKPEKVGPVSSQPGQCFFRDPAGKVFISACDA